MYTTNMVIGLYRVPTKNLGFQLTSPAGGAPVEQGARLGQNIHPHKRR